MTAHLAVPKVTLDELPGTLNPKITTDILRNELNSAESSRPTRWKWAQLPKITRTGERGDGGKSRSGRGFVSAECRKSD
jgi:hypothetical protein